MQMTILKSKESEEGEKLDVEIGISCKPIPCEVDCEGILLASIKILDVLGFALLVEKGDVSKI